MTMHTVSFRTESDIVEALDALASAQQRDRTFILNEAIQNYLSLQRYHCDLIAAGLRDMEQGKVVSHEQVLAEIKTWKKKK